MKTITQVLVFAASLTILLACDKEVSFSIEPSKGNERTVEFSTAPITKTVFGDLDGSTYPTLWTTNKTVAVSMNYGTAKQSSTPELSSGGATARFTADIDAGEATAFQFYAVSPFSAIVSTSSFSSSNKNVKVIIPSDQTPIEGSVDENAQLIAASYDAGDTFPNSVTMNFSHITAYGLMSFQNLALEEGESIASVALTSSLNWAGQFYYYYEDNGPNSAGDVVVAAGANTINITTTSESNIWFACAPVEIGGTDVDVVVTTNTGSTYSKTISFPAGRRFQSGHIAKFNIDMDGILADGAVVYTRVEDVSELTVDSEVIIVASGYDYALSTTQNTNNRGQAGVTKSTNGSGDAIIVSPSASVQVITIANGNKAGTYAFMVGSDYLYAVSGNNYLKTKNALDNLGSWAISVTGSGIATIKSIGTNDSKILRYASVYSCFSCYGSGQNDVSIYKRDGTGSAAITPKVPESLSISGATTEYKVGASYSFDGTVKLVYSDSSEEVISSSAYTVDSSEVNTSSAGTYTVNISYNANPSIVGSYEVTVTSYKSVIYTVSSTTAVSTSGTAPDGSSATYEQTYNTAGSMTSGNSITLTLSGFDGKTIKGAIVSVHSNSNGGRGSLLLSTGSDTIASIAENSSFKDVWYGSWSTEFVNVILSTTDRTVASDNNIILHIVASANSLFFQSLTLYYD